MAGLAIGFFWMNLITFPTFYGFLTKTFPLRGGSKYTRDDKNQDSLAGMYHLSFFFPKLG